VPGPFLPRQLKSVGSVKWAIDALTVHVQSWYGTCPVFRLTDQLVSGSKAKSGQPWEITRISVRP
jgi:hypothetical protein